MIHENPFADGVPTHFAIAATVYTQPLQKLEAETKTKRSKLLLVIGGYGNGKSHALERLKNDLNLNETKKLAIYCSAFATKSLRGIYEQMCSELIAGKFKKVNDSSEGRTLMETKGVPEKILNLFYKDSTLRDIEDMKDDLAFGRIVASSSDVISFFCAVSVLVDQLVILMDDIEEASFMERASRKEFFGYIRALYDQAVRKDLNMITVLAFTPDKLNLLQEDRADLYGRIDNKIVFDKPTLKEMTDILNKRLEISGLDNYKISSDVLKKVHEYSSSIRGVFNLLRDALEVAVEKNETAIKDVKLPEKKPSSEKPRRDGHKPADDIILGILKEEDGLLVDDIIKRSKKSAPWIKHRIADLMKAGLLRKEQEARNKPAKYYLGEGE